MKSNAIDIANFLKKKLSGKKISINGISSLDKLKTNSLVFLEKDRINKNFINKLNKTKNLLLITNSKNIILKNYSCIFTKNPRLDYNKIIKHFMNLKLLKNEFTHLLKLV